MTRAFYKGGRGALVVGDLAAVNMLGPVADWKADLDKKACSPHREPLPAVLLANKVDLPDVQLDAEGLNDFAQLHRFTRWFDTSAKTGYHLTEALEALCVSILDLECQATDRDTSTVESDDENEGTVDPSAPSGSELSMDSKGCGC
ncbi:small GTPase superfamily, Rab type, partial [Kipferlia bialata]|eukprot:g8448.t1